MSEKEDLNIFEIKHAITKQNFKLPNVDDLKEIFAQVINDNLIITLSANDDPTSLSSSNSDYAGFLANLNSKLQYLEDNDDVELTILISKKENNGNINIYCLDFFNKFLQSIGVYAFLVLINDLLRKYEALTFHVDGLAEEFHSNSIFFVTAKEDSVQNRQFNNDREKKVGRINSVSHLTGIVNNCLVPEDFSFIKQPQNLDEIKLLFSKACFILVLGVIFDYSSISKSTFESKINGYKTIIANTITDSINTQSLSEYYKIYQWAFEGGNLVDKIGLSRNLVSLNLDKGDNYSLNEGVFTSIYSGFKVYEKQNVKQYIELRNKISDQIINFNEKAGKIVDSFAAGFQKSALAFVSLFSTIIVVRVLTTNNFINIFTPDATIISLAFLLISYLYYRVIKKEVNQERKRFVDSYNNMKKRNGDLLTVEDINLILNNDFEHNANLEFIDKKEKEYSKLWCRFLVVFLAAILILFSLYNLDTFLQSRIFNIFRALSTCQC